MEKREVSVSIFQFQPTKSAFVEYLSSSYLRYCGPKTAGATCKMDLWIIELFYFVVQTLESKDSKKGDWEVKFLLNIVYTNSASVGEYSAGPCFSLNTGTLSISPLSRSNPHTSRATFPSPSIYPFSASPSLCLPGTHNMCALVLSLKRSSLSLVRNSHVRLFSSLPRSSSSSLYEEPAQFEDSARGRSFLRFFPGLLVASGVGVWLLSSSSSTFADSLEVVEAVQPEQVKKTRYLFPDSYRRRIFFNYEKRIRTQSPPEKVFEYFASHRASNGEVLMTPADLMRAVVPVFPPSESNIVREGYLRGEQRPGDLKCPPSKFFMLFDTNNDGLISFPEYIFFVTLLSIPETSFSVAFKMFDIDHNGEIALEEFKKVMVLMQSFNRQGARHKNGKRHVLKAQKHVENGGLLEYFFGKDGNGNLQHEKFVHFLKDLHDEILCLEFTHYDHRSRGTISAKDFALSMVASADMNHIKKFLDRVDELNDDPHLQEVRITFEEFKAFAELRKRLKSFALAIFGYGKVNGLLTKDDFRRAVSHVCGITLTDNVVDVVFHVFDSNSDGSISSEEFLHVLQKRQRDMAHPVGSGFAAVFSCWLNCAKSCSIQQMLY
ncbi:hypothetical protein H6P81_010181 [Aristolochia fimbriata]|uniref:EF-hand domain-containing protein n=1 Tax=Aristolochia fimbriata TaxID=158543 RepID=A0AAV7EP77_ARIFI|nr:hypothetical protein H6P81_010181 [Aristolochia fimbriata]